MNNLREDDEDDDPVDWTVFDTPLPPVTPEDPRAIAIREETKRQIAENRKKAAELNRQVNDPCD